jgi:hypothetical protein
MAVIYMNDMVHGMYFYSGGIMSPILKVQWQGRDTDHLLSSSADIVNVWSYNPTDSNLNELFLHWSEFIGNFGNLFFSN